MFVTFDDITSQENTEQKEEKVAFISFLENFDFKQRNNVEEIFKRKAPKKQYFQVKSQIINKGQ